MTKKPAAVMIVLHVYFLSQQGAYIKKMVTFDGTRNGLELPHDLELPLCLMETSDGFKLSFDPSDLPEKPDPEPPENREPDLTLTFSDQVSLTTVRPPLALPENPTARERWEYLAAELKRR